MDLGMELHSPNAAVVVGDAGEGIHADRGAMETSWKLFGFVAVAHPDREGMRQPGKERIGGVFNGHFGVAVFALGPGADLPPEVMDDEVETIADAESGEAELEHLRVRGRRVGVIDRRRAAGEDDADGLIALDFA